MNLGRYGGRDRGQHQVGLQKEIQTMSMLREAQTLSILCTTMAVAAPPPLQMAATPNWPGVS